MIDTCIPDCITNCFMHNNNAAAVVQHVDDAAERAKLHGEVMACAYEDVQVMWSMLDQTTRIGDLSGSS